MNKIDEIDAKLAEIMSMLEDVINNKHTPTINRILSMDEIADVVGSYFGVSLKQMRSDSREGHIMKARHMAKHIMSEEFYYTPMQIGKFINCSRTSVYPTIYRVNNWLDVDAKYKKLYGFVMGEISEKSRKTLDS